jgi:hypothetical protein
MHVDLHQIFLAMPLFRGVTFLPWLLGRREKSGEDQRALREEMRYLLIRLRLFGGHVRPLTLILDRCPVGFSFLDDIAE